MRMALRAVAAATIYRGNHGDAYGLGELIPELEAIDPGLDLRTARSRDQGEVSVADDADSFGAAVFDEFLGICFAVRDTEQPPGSPNAFETFFTLTAEPSECTGGWALDPSNTQNTSW